MANYFENDSLSKRDLLAQSRPSDPCYTDKEEPSQDHLSWSVGIVLNGSCLVPDITPLISNSDTLSNCKSSTFLDADKSEVCARIGVDPNDCLYFGEQGSTISDSSESDVEINISNAQSTSSLEQDGFCFASSFSDENVNIDTADTVSMVTDDACSDDRSIHLMSIDDIHQIVIDETDYLPVHNEPMLVDDEQESDYFFQQLAFSYQQEEMSTFARAESQVDVDMIDESLTKSPRLCKFCSSHGHSSKRCFFRSGHFEYKRNNRKFSRLCRK